MDRARRSPRQCQEHHGVTVELETIGEQEQQAMDALVALMNDKFGEGE
jgi:phosphotransferase system HPr-like phosphotransfer protein